MDKQAFLTQMRESLTGLPQEDVAEHLNFYREMIDDRLEEGLTEEAAVAELGPVEDIVAQIVADYPLPKLVRESVRAKRRLRGWEIALLVLGCPVWLPLLIAAAAVLFSLYLVLWCLVVSLWAVELAFVAGALGGLAVGVLLLFRGDGAKGLALLGAGLLLGGLAIFLAFGCRAAGVGVARLTGKMVLGVKARLMRKEREQ